jgi:hypothetical protein
MTASCAREQAKGKMSTGPFAYNLLQRYNLLYTIFKNRQLFLWSSPNGTVILRIVFT